MNISRCSLSVAADKDTMYAIGGRTKDQLLDVAERFDPKTNSWCRVASIREKKRYSHAAILKGKVFLFGGCTSRRALNVTSRNIEMYDPITNIWTAIQSTSAPKRFLGATSFKGAIYVVGLWNQESSNVYCLRVYDVDKNEWKHCADIPLNSPRAVLAPLRI